MDSASWSMVFFDSLQVSSSDTILYLHDGWLNDVCIALQFLRLETYVLDKRTKEDVVLMDPSAAFWVALSPSDEDSAAVLAPLTLPSKKCVLCPVNSNTEITPGGTHWSLLCLLKNEETQLWDFYHLDSLGTYNLEQAKHLAKRLRPHLFVKDAAGSSSASSLSPPLKLNSPKLLQQTGGECGVNVVIYAEHIATNFDKMTASDMFARMKDNFGPSTAKLRRSEMYAFAMDERRRSLKKVQR